jgi:hypothetical protein
MRKNLLDKEHPYHKEVAAAMRETFCVGVLETDSKKIVKGAFVLALIQLFFPWWLRLNLENMMIMALIWLYFNLKNMMILGLIWLLLFYAAVDIENLSVVVLGLSAIFIYYKEIQERFKVLGYSTLIIITRGWIIKWVATGYLQNQPFRQRIIEDDENSSLIASLVLVVEKKYRANYDQLLNLYLSSATEDGEDQLKRYIDQLSEENKEKTQYIT